MMSPNQRHALEAKRRTAVLTVTLAGVASIVGAQPLSSDAPPLGLRAAIAEALERSPRLASAESERASAELRRDAEAASFGLRLTPTLTGGVEALGLVRQSVGLGVSKQFVTGGELSVTTSSFRFDGAMGDQRDAGVSVRFSQPLWSLLGRTATAGVERAEREVDLARLGLADRRAELVLAVAGHYASVLRHERLLGASRRALDRARTLYDATAARTRAGLATELDTMRAALLSGQAEASVARDEDALALARDRLRALLGRPFDSPLTLADDETALVALAEITTPVAPHDIVRLVSMAVARRVDRQQADARVDSARRAVDIARWQVLPPIAVEAGYSRWGLLDGGGAAGPWLSGGWHIGITTGAGAGYAASRTSQRAAALHLRAAEQAARDAATAIDFEVRAAARAVLGAERGVALQQAALSLAERQRELVDVRYERGLATSLDLADAETTRAQAEAALVGARIDHALARLALERAVGGLVPGGAQP